MVEDVKANPLDSPFQGGYYVTKILNAVEPIVLSKETTEVVGGGSLDAVNPIGGAKVKIEAGEGPSQLVQDLPTPALKEPEYYRRKSQEAIQLEMLAAQQTIFYDYRDVKEQHRVFQEQHRVLQEQHRVLQEQHQVLQEQKQLLEVEVGNLKTAMSTPVEEKPEYVELQNQLVQSRVETEEHRTSVTRLERRLLDSRLAEERYKSQLEDLTDHHRALQTDHEVLTKQMTDRAGTDDEPLRQFLLYTWKGKEVGQSDDASDEVQLIRHFPSRKGKEVVESDAEEDYRVEDPVHSVSVDGVLALSYYIPPAHNVEHACAFDRQLFFLVADLVL